MRQEVARLEHVHADCVHREHTGGVKSLFRAHESDGPTASPAIEPRAVRDGLNITGLFDAEVGVGEAARLLTQP